MHRPLLSLALFHASQRSLVRGNLLVLGSFFGSFPLSGFPQNRPTLLLLIPAVIALLGMIDTVRCLPRRWNLYHGGVVLLLLMDTLALSLIMMFLLLPYLF